MEFAFVRWCDSYRQKKSRSMPALSVYGICYLGLPYFCWMLYKYVLAEAGDVNPPDLMKMAISSCRVALLFALYSSTHFSTFEPLRGLVSLCFGFVGTLSSLAISASRICIKLNLPYLIPNRLAFWCNSCLPIFSTTSAFIFVPLTVW